MSTATAKLTTGIMLVAGLAAGTAHANPILLVEADTGRVLEQQDAGKPWYQASVTKLMTVYVALNAVKNGRLTMDSPLTVSPLAASQQPSKMGFKPGTVVTLDNALKMVLVKSANDMAMVVAEGVGGSMPAFVDEMNATAAHLGMSGTHYSNPNGLPDPGQISTARDLAILARALIYHFPEHEMLFRIPSIKLGKAVLRNYNRLIDRYPGADGMKTGFVCGSGYNLVATATRGGKRLIAVVLGARSGTVRAEGAAMLFEKGFQASWGIFGSAAPTLSAIQNTGGEPFDMKPYVCGGKRAATASEADDDGASVSSSAISFALAAGNPTMPRSGADLLQTLPPSMPPVPVFVGTRTAPQDLGSAYAADDDDKPKKKPAAASAATTKKPADAKASKTKPATASSAKPAPKPSAKKPSGTTEASSGGTKTTTQGAKPVTASAAAAPKPKLSPKPLAMPRPDLDAPAAASDQADE
ncbi:D-alanyl-D-alanine carboxypeptidase family protein [Xanthobacter agilis]|uniref:D-alanyl-D-alanine carboxypeptidase n=1 Tax=Xanthobacter agilis TaxID=47492 RepID=A0ABU0L9J8_XANAG|nr:D-alanyl-D-alanine carboxypeptidase family protein [Xanthobacter agilis]MDQ0503762.1 D-alanyl-D-alanine carboxypeptidase [Xanthobacter agilis]